MNDVACLALTPLVLRLTNEQTARPPADRPAAAPEVMRAVLSRYEGVGE